MTTRALIRGIGNVLQAGEGFGGRCPDTLILIGGLPEEVEDHGGGLRDVVVAQIDPAISIPLSKLDAIGITAERGRSDDPLLADNAINRVAFEAGRPAAEAACRTGDDRFFPVGG